MVFFQKKKWIWYSRVFSSKAVCREKTNYLGHSLLQFSSYHNQIYFNFVPGFSFCCATSVGSSSDLAVLLTCGTSILKDPSCCSFEVDIKHFGVSLGLFSSLTDLLVMSVKEIVRPPCISAKAEGLRMGS